MKIGIVGMPNAGKSSLFNALTRAGAQAANYPFTTVEPNVAVVPVPDERLDRVAETIGARPIVHETIEFHDIAGLVHGAHQGEGLATSSSANIRETDAILHVVRVHDDAQVVHPEGRVDPLADVETIETELLFADLEQAERRLERVAKQAKSWDKGRMPRSAGCAKWSRRCGRAARCAPCPCPTTRPEQRRGSQPLTSKPVLYVANVAEGEPLEPPPELVAHAGERGARATAVSARLDAELSELDEEDAAAMRDELGVGESGLETVIREAFALLDLITFFTAGQDKEARAWAIPRGTRARAAAGSIHTDIERGFVAAEVVPWEAPGGGRRLRGGARARPEARRGPRVRDAGRRRGDVPLHAVLARVPPAERVRWQKSCRSELMAEIVRRVLAASAGRATMPHGCAASSSSSFPACRRWT